jgi:hypothetical protein
VSATTLPHLTRRRHGLITLTADCLQILPRRSVAKC